MVDRPILFSGPMVLALLAGRKTQTRRVARLKRGITISDIPTWTDSGGGTQRAVFGREQIEEPRIAVGDRLYVREAWRTGGQHDHIAPRDLPQEWAGPIGYVADEAPNTISRTGRFRQGMHMPRWASRLTLIVTKVGVQRLQEISEADAMAEGCTLGANNGTSSNAVFQYSVLWDGLNADRGYSWSDNPWVAAYSFTVHRRNINELPR